MRDRTVADDIVQGAYNRALLDLILPPMRSAAKEAGYALAVHGSLNRDIDLIAVPWTDSVWTSDALVDSLCGAVRGVIGRCSKFNSGWEQKPHGRIGRILLAWAGEHTVSIDLSVMPATTAQSNEGDR